MDMAKVREYIKLRRHADELDSEAKESKKLADELEQELLEAFATDGVQNLKIEGVTVYLHRQLWATREQDKTKEDLIAALEKAGLAHFVSESVSMQSLSSWVRDLEENEEELPPELVGVLGRYEKFQVRTRRS